MKIVSHPRVILEEWPALARLATEEPGDIVVCEKKTL
jgi:hypothetical protein